MHESKTRSLSLYLRARVSTPKFEKYKPTNVNFRHVTKVKHFVIFTRKNFIILEYAPEAIATN